MQNNVIKFDIEVITNIIVDKIGNVSDPAANTRGKENRNVEYRHLRAFKKDLGLQNNDSLDVILLADFPEKDKRIQEIHNRLNFKLNGDPRIATFFKGAGGMPFFHFPLGLNFYILSPEQMHERKSAYNPWIIFNMGLSGVHGLCKNNKNDKYLIIYNVEFDPYFIMDDYVLKTWDK